MDEIAIRSCVKSDASRSDAGPLPALTGGPRTARGRLVHAGLAVLGGLVLGVGTSSAAAPAAPTNLRGSSPTDGQLVLLWSDNSNNELRFRFEVWRVGESDDWSVLGYVGPNQTSATITGLEADTTYRFRMRAENGDGFSGYSNTFEILISHLSVISLCERSVSGTPFRYTVETPSAPADRAIALSDLPDGLAVEPGGQTVSGTLSTPGIVSFLVSVTAANHAPRQNRVGIFVVQPPEPTNAPSRIELVDTAPGSIDLGTQFNDPDSETIVRFVTSEGDIDVALTDSAAPLTVANFLAYADANAWDGTFFHRAIADFVNQGGGYRPAGDGTFAAIPDNPPVQNEFGTDRRNVCGTISMAKLGGDPDSATNEWFFSVSDNSANLDNQNGGFTVFGRVMGDGMDVVRAINSLPTGDYLITLDGQLREFRDWPLRGGAASPTTPGALALVDDVARIAPLEYSIDSQPPGDLATASIDGTSLVVAPASGAAGEASLVVRATDRDGLSTTRSFSVVVSRTFSAWIEDATGIPPGERGPLSDSERDGVPHLLEFVLGGDPAVPDAGRTAPRPGQSIIDGTAYPTAEFTLAGYTSGTTCSVERATDLETWVTVWDSSQGFDAPPVVSANDGDEAVTRLVVRSDLSLAEAPHQALRIRATLAGAE